MVIDDIGSLIIAAGLGTINTTLFFSAKANIPVGPLASPITVLTEYGGSGPTRIQNQAAAATRRPSVQVSCRANTYPAARSLAEQIFLVTDGVFNRTISGTFYLRIVAIQEPTDAGLDADTRPQVVFNLETEKQP